MKWENVESCWMSYLVSNLIDAYCKASFLHDAFVTFQCNGMKMNLSWHCHLHNFYYFILQQMVLMLHNEMFENGILPNFVIYSTLLNHECCKAGKLNEVGTLWMKMENWSFV